MRASVPMVVRQEPVPGFWRWWRDELRGFLPAAWRRRGAPSRCILLLLEGREIHVLRRRGRKTTGLGLLRLGTAMLTELPFAQALARRREPVWLVLRPQDGILAHDTLPGGAERDLRLIMRHRVEVLTPLPEQAVYSDARILARRPDGVLDVELMVAPRDLLDPILADLEALSLVPAGVDVLLPGGLPGGFDLLGGTGRRPVDRMRLAVMGGLGAACIVALAGWGGVVVYGQERELARQQDHLAALEARFADLPVLRDRIEAERQQAGFVAQRRHDAGSATVVLEMLSRILPDDAWLTELQLEGRDLTISGYAATSAELVPMIEASTHFSGVHFRAPSTRTRLSAADGTTRNVDRFSIEATVSPMLEPRS